MPQPIPLSQIFPGLSPAWAAGQPPSTLLEHTSVKKAKPAGVINLTSGALSTQTDILALHFPLDEATPAPGAVLTVTVEDVEDTDSGATEAQDTVL